MSKTVYETIMVGVVTFTMLFDAVFFLPVFFKKPKPGVDQFPQFKDTYFWVILFLLNACAVYLTRPGFLR
jgi:hypothetical protein